MKLIIPKPCSQNWSDMEPTIEGKFCSACSKTVVDFTALTDAQLELYFKKKAKNVCGRLSAGQIDRTLAKSGSTETTKRNAKLKSPLLLGLSFSIVNVSLGIQVPDVGKVRDPQVMQSGTAATQRTMIQESIESRSNLTDHNNKQADTVITGIVRDGSGLPIPAASVTFSGTPIGVLTRDDGTFILKIPAEQISDRLVLSISHISYDVKEVIILAPFPKTIDVSLIELPDISHALVSFLGGIYIKPTKWQLVKNWFVFWK